MATPWWSYWQDGRMMTPAERNRAARSAGLAKVTPPRRRK